MLQAKDVGITGVQSCLSRCGNTDNTLKLHLHGYTDETFRVDYGGKACAKNFMRFGPEGVDMGLERVPFNKDLW